MENIQDPVKSQDPILKALINNPRFASLPVDKKRKALDVYVKSHSKEADPAAHLQELISKFAVDSEESKKKIQNLQTQGLWTKFLAILKDLFLPPWKRRNALNKSGKIS